VRSSKYLNNMIEQDHRRIKQRTRALRRRAKLRIMSPAARGE
jgi:transposase-like protein